MQQKGLKKLKGKIVVKTGLHIGGGNDKVEIGGIDNPVIRNPLTLEPYIPGSSIKGKMRALLEWKNNKVKDSNGEPCKCMEHDCPICRVFGSGNSKEEKAKIRGPSRLIIRDAELTDDYIEKFHDGQPIIEEKTENTINRITAVANPRQMERVIPNVTFNFELVYRIIDTGHKGKDGKLLDEEYFDTVVIEGLKLLEKDYLGGGGTRGNGRIKFVDLKDENDNLIKL